MFYSIGNESLDLAHKEWFTVPGQTALLFRPTNCKRKEILISCFLSSLNQHNRFVLDCKDKEPDVLFVGDSMVRTADTRPRGWWLRFTGTRLL